ncbi:MULTISPECIES: Ldh family oxidoreductase [Qipengyuania]|uniref:Ldh family oxidoreductase n=1 Tax=Qipengyuania soli TaxID=2782568 RepID=A0A7S8F4U7_9SPHN|nr:Ldh family oxidoreductase [Qipengyuania soli]QPC99130.1 Ldh family oxidoreductase [Qipengyuania soli]
MRIDLATYRRALGDLIAGAGVDAAQAETLADNLAWCDMAGRRNHGIERLPIMFARVRSGAIKCPCEPRFEQKAPTIALLDADGGFGHHAGKLAMDRACEISREQGIGAVGVRNSNFYGAGAYYAQLAAQRGMIGIALSNSFPKVAAHGGKRAALGTNPLSFAAPRDAERSIIVDMSTAALAGSTVREAMARGTPLEPGLAIDAEGAPVLDPASAAAATLLPAAGAKGFGLAIMVEILSGVLTGAGIGGEVRSMYHDLDRAGANGHFMLAIDIARWMPIEEFGARMEMLCRWLLPEDAPEGARLPGDARWSEIARSHADGVLVEDRTLGEIERLADELGLQPAWTH